MKTLATYAPRGCLAVAPRAWGGEFAIFVGAPTLFAVEGDAAVVTIQGPLTHHATGMFDSYDGIKARIDSALASDQQRLILRIDSPGGDVSGCFELAHYIREACVKAGKRSAAFSDGMMCSAAYALGCACDEVYAAPSANIGSIGVLETMVDLTRQDAAMGVRFVFARSGAKKGFGNPHAPIETAAIETMQAHTDATAALFFELVAEMRGLDADDIAELEAGVFLGAEAAARGLVTGVVSWSELVSGAIGANGGKAMAKKLTEYLASLAEGEDKDEAKKARKALAALLAEDDAGEKKDEPKKEEGSAAAAASPAASEEPKKDEAKAEDEKKDAKAADEEKKEAKAAAAGPDVSALARELHAMRAERAIEKDTAARAAIFATRPDIAPDTQRALASTPTASLQKVVDSFPRIPTGAIAASVVGTVGKDLGSGELMNVAPHVADAIDIKMGLTSSVAKVENVGHELHLGLLTPEQARARLVTMNGGK
jgi:ClpP class serine protease